MSRTYHRNTLRERDGYSREREPKPSPRRTASRAAEIRAELAAEADRVTPGVRKPYLSRSGR